MAAIGITLVSLLVAGKALEADALNTRQAAFQVRAMLHGMPNDGTVYAHECTRHASGAWLVAAGLCDGSGHLLYVNGKQASAVASDGTVTVSPSNTVYASKAACVDAYSVARGVDYFRHNALCTVKHAHAKQARMTKRGVGITGVVLTTMRPRKASKRTAK
jgi:hypothetical protein